MKIVVRVAAFAAVLAGSYGIAILLPDDNQSVIGQVAIGAVAVGTVLWARRDGRLGDPSAALRDWLVVAAVISVFWWVTLMIYEGAEDVAGRLSDEFVSVVVTAGVLFATAVVGLLLGRDARD